MYINRLLVKEQVKRMKLSEVPSHPWIVQTLAAAQAAAQATAAAPVTGIIQRQQAP